MSRAQEPGGSFIQPCESTGTRSHKLSSRNFTTPVSVSQDQGSKQHTRLCLLQTEERAFLWSMPSQLQQETRGSRQVSRVDGSVWREVNHKAQPPSAARIPPAERAGLPGRGSGGDGKGKVQGKGSPSRPHCSTQTRRTHPD